jgi:hypothetical protein
MVVRVSQFTVSMELMVCLVPPVVAVNVTV